MSFFSKINDESIKHLNARLYKNGKAVLYFDRFPSIDNDNNITSIDKKTKKPRKYSIKRTIVQSACVELWRLKKSKHCLFLTFTFPFHCEANQPSEIIAAKIWDTTLNTLRNVYKVYNYVWVKEPQSHNNNRLHYHIIVDRNRIDFKSLEHSFESHCRRYWHSNINTYRNCVRTYGDPRVRSVFAIKNYLSKYISKDIFNYSRPAFGHSEGFALFRTIDINTLIKTISQNKDGEIFISFADKIRISFIDDFFCILEIQDYVDLSP